MTRRATRHSGSSFDGQRLVEARRATFQTQEEIAHRLGVSLRSVQRWEGNQSAPQLRQVRAIAAAFGREPAWFMTVPNGDGDKAAA
jgi:transcriptional regulator with XRE-family HTH domain